MLRRTSPLTRGDNFDSRIARGFQVDKAELLACSLATALWGSLLRDRSEEEARAIYRGVSGWMAVSFVSPRRSCLRP